MKKADIIIKSSAVFTGMEEINEPRIIVIIDNKIAALEEAEKLSQWAGPETKIIDAGDCTVMPGFVDAHMHFYDSSFISSPRVLDTLMGCKSEEECVQQIKEFAEKHEDYERIVATGWLPLYWEDPTAFPHKRSLDAIIPDKPVYCMAGDGHSFWLNSKALEECGVTPDTEFICGSVDLDDEGNMTGVLREIEPSGPCNTRAFSSSIPVMKEMQEALMKRMIQCGITSVADMAVDPNTSEVPATYLATKELEEEGKLPLRIHAYYTLGLTEDLTMARRLREKYNSDKFCIAGLKQFVDGLTYMYTAYLLDDYCDRPGNKGELSYTKEFLEPKIINANKEGFGVKLHCIGDGAVRIALDSYEEAKKQTEGHLSCRNSVEHVEMLDPADVSRFAELDVGASMQPVHMYFIDEQKKESLGPERMDREWQFKTITEQGGVLAFSTDYPVVDFNPFPNIYTAVARKDSFGNELGTNPQEKISRKEALKAYTYGGAYNLRREDKFGTLSPGKLADIIVLDRNIFKIPEEDIPETQVRYTLSDGKIVWGIE